MNTIYWFVEYAVTFVEILLCFLFCGTFMSREKLNIHKNLILLLSATESGIIIFINTFSLFSEITSFISISLTLIMQYIIYRRPVKSLIFTMTYFAILAASDFSIVYLIAYIAELPTGEILLKHSVIRLMGLVLTKSLLSFIIYTIYKFKTVKGMFSKKHLFELSAFAVSMLLFLLYVVFKDINSNTEKLSDMSVLFFIVSLILILLFFFGVIKIAEFYENRQQMSLLSLRNRMLETSMAETEKTFSLWQSSLHDHKHNIIHLLALAKKNDINGIENCLEKEFKLLSQKLFYYKTGNDTVDAVLYIKQTLANENGITFLINAVIPQKCPVTDAHLCAILGNLTDNAINASKNEPEPHIEVSIRQIKNYLIIKVLNRFTAPDEKIFKPKKGQSFYGIGLKSVRHTVQSYNGEFTAKVENNMFSAKIMIQM